MRLQNHILVLSLCVVAFCVPVATAQQPPTLNLKQGINGSEPGAPIVNVTVDRRRVPLGTIVTFTLSPAHVVRSSRYSVTLKFGDGKQQSVRATEISHLYQAVGTYFYSVQVKSIRQPPQVGLSAGPVPVSAGQPVSFSAQLSWSYPNIQYRFSFGDGIASAWQDYAKANHAYQSEGRYSAYVDIRDGTQPLGGSTRKEIEVTGTTKPFRVEMTANPITAKARRPVTFVARALPAGGNTRYRFEFGDSQFSAWQANALATHVYSKSGNYRARVEASRSDSGRSSSASSAPTLIAIQGPPTPNPSPGPTPRPSPQPTPTSSPSPVGSPSPTNNSSPSSSPASSPSPFGSTSPSPDGSTSPGPTGTAQNGGGSSSSSPGGNSSPGSGALSNGEPGGFGFPNNWWKYLLIAALILFLIYQVSGLLFVARPAFTPFADQGVSTVANSERGLPIDFQLLLNRNVSTGTYEVETSEPRFVKNSDRLEERQILEI
jgi:hypothetical protein